MEVKRDELEATEEAPSPVEEDIAKPGEVAKEEGDDQAPEPDDKEGVPDAPPVEDNGTAPDVGEAAQAEAETVSTENTPAPTQEDLFGNIDQLKKQHEEELAEFEKAQEMNKARVEQGLQEKLRARRSRRRKIKAQEAEANALSGGEGLSNDLPPPSEIAFLQPVVS